MSPLSWCLTRSENIVCRGPWKQGRMGLSCLPLPAATCTGSRGEGPEHSSGLQRPQPFALCDHQTDSLGETVFSWLKGVTLHPAPVCGAKAVLAMRPT